MAKKFIGIDLGSTLSEVAVIEGGKPEVITNSEGSRTTPSVICFADGDRKVGGPAKRQMVVHPKETVNLIKRFMGATYEESKEAMTHVQYDVVESNGLPRAKVNDREYSPEELSSIIIAKLKKTAEDYLGSTVTDAVISVPANFSDNARKATKQAAELAGLNVLRIIAEPTAALLSSNIDKEKGGKYMVVDYGGATADCSVADVGDNVIEILATDGDVYLGGSDIDKKIADWVVDEFKSDKGVDLRDDVQAMQRIMEGVEKAKIELSSSTMTEINLPYITAKDGMPQHLMMEITRAKFENLISGEVDKLMKLAKSSLKQSKLEAKDLNGILLVGGSCRIPLVQERLEKEFGVELIKSANLDLAVAEGAAVQANIIMGGEGSSDVLLLDVIPLSLGIETEGGVMAKIIEGNTTIPCKRSQIFSTAADNQPSVDINVVQGERPLVRDNKSIGLFRLDGIAPARRGVPQIEVTFEVDANAIVSVSATDKGTGKEQHITIETKGRLTDDEIERIKAEAKAHEEEDAKTQKEIEKANRCEGLIYQTEQSLDNLKGNAALTQEDKDYFNTKIEQLKKMKDEKSFDNFDEIEKEVLERWNSVSTKAYSQGQDNGAASSMMDTLNDIVNAKANNNKNDDIDVQEV